MVQGQQHEALSQWMTRIRGRSIPALSQTVLDIARITGSERSSAAELAHVILRDPSLTTRVLQVANSVFLNPHGHPIHTVTRAVVMLGYGAVRRVSISVAVIDDLARGAHRERLLRELARSFHAATQAQSYARELRDSDPEEIYIAALLRRLGEIAFWGSGDGTADYLDLELRRDAASPAIVERRVLGFSLAQLTARLNQEWHVSSLLDFTFSPAAGADRRVSLIGLGHEIAGCAEDGWGTPPFLAAVDRLAAVLHRSRKDTIDLVRAGAREAASVTAGYSAPQISRLIPQPE